MLRGIRWPVLLAVLTLAGFSIGATALSADCCVGPHRGNVDLSPEDTPTLGDLTALVDHLFISLDPPACWSEANLDGSLPEGPGSISLGDLTVMIDLLFVSLRTPPFCPESQPPVGELVGHGSCKSAPGKASLDDPPATQDCLDWSYDGYGTLTIRHINAGFNCCPVILADVEVIGNKILITQIDSLWNGGCSCLCLFDLSYEITNIDPGTYSISVTEPYLPEGDAEFEFGIDLTAEPTGRFCLPRSTYPWIEW